MNYLTRLVQLETRQSPTDRTDKSTSVGFVSPLPVRIETKTLDKATGEPLPDPAMEGRRRRVLAMLDKRPGIRYAVLVDNPDTDPVLLTLAIRGQATCEPAIPAAKFDAFLLIDLLARHGAETVH